MSTLSRAGAFVLALALGLVMPGLGTAQTVSDSAGVVGPAEQQSPSLAGEYRLRDILTANYQDLVLWLQDLGLDSRGSIEALRNRLARFYGVELGDRAGSTAPAGDSTAAGSGATAGTPGTTPGATAGTTGAPSSATAGTTGPPPGDDSNSLLVPSEPGGPASGGETSREVADGEAGKTVIRIEILSANSIQRIQRPAEGGFPAANTIVLSGNVHLRVSDVGEGTSAGTGAVAGRGTTAAGTSATVHSIRAEEVRIDQDHKLLNARGSVEYRLETEGRSETFTGQELQFDVSSWAGVFVQGSSTQVGDSSRPDSFKYSASSIRRSAEDIIILTDGVITSSELDPPSYTIKAKEIIILGNGEWVIDSPVLYLGNIPMIALPGFYNPSSQLVFHPNFGTEAVRGEYLRTTYYILGQQRQSRALFDFLRFDSSEENQDLQLRGLFLEPKPGAGSAGRDWLKLYLDYYSRLGIHAGTELFLTGSDVLKELQLYAGVGFTRNIYSSDAGFSGLYRDPITLEYEPVWNQPWLGAARLPFRFGVNLRARLEFNPGVLSVILPFASDGRFFSDLSGRSELIEWGRFLSIPEDTQAGSEKVSVLQNPSSELSNYVWQVIFSGNFSFPDIAWLDGLNIQRLSSEVTWRSVRIDPGSIPDATASAYQTSDARTLVIEVLRPLRADFSLSGSIGTTVLSSSSSQAGQPASQPGGNGQASDPAAKVTVPPAVRPESSGEAADAAQLGDTSVAAGAQPEPDDEGWPEPQGPSPILPATIQVPNNVPPLRPATARLRYSLSSSTELNGVREYESTIIPDSIIDRLSYWQAGENLRLGLGLVLSSENSLLEFSTELRSTWVERGALDVSGDIESDPSKLDSLTRRLETSNQFRIEQTNTLTLRPLQAVEGFGESTLVYRFNPLWYSRSFSGTDGAGVALYDNLPFTFSRDSITGHDIAFELVYKELAGEYPPVFTIQTNASLPPRNVELGVKTALSFGKLLRLEAATSFDIVDDGSEASLRAEPVTASLNFAYLDLLRASAGLTWDPDVFGLTAMNLGLGIWKLDTSLRFNYEKHWRYTTADGWKRGDTDEFLPTVFSLRFGDVVEPAPEWFNRIQQQLSYQVNWTQGLQKITDSVLSFDLSYSLAIYKSLDLTFKTRSSNTQMYLYFPFLFDNLPDDVPIRPRDFFVDLFDSFNFFNDEARRNSGFKLNEISVSLEHYLDAWTLSLGFSIKPQLNSTRDAYFWDSRFNVEIEWTPIPEIRQTIRSDASGTLELTDEQSP